MMVEVEATVLMWQVGREPKQHVRPFSCHAAYWFRIPLLGKLKRTHAAFLSSPQAP